MSGLAAHRIEASWTPARGRTPRVRCIAPPPTPIAALLRGKTPEAALGLIPLVFNLCAGAQEAAARTALGLPRDADVGRRIAAEALREHALRCLKDWPEALGLEPNLPALIGIGRLDHTAADARLRAIETALFGPDGVDGFDDPIAFAKDVDAVAARALRVVLEWPPEWGLDPAAVAPPMDPTLLRRVTVDARLAPYLISRGATLFVRMAARLVDAARMIETLRGERPPLLPDRLAPGVGAAEAARGRLIHRARVEAGRIADYAVETPTDAVMGEGAMLARMIAAAAGAPPELRKRVARLAILACDPCAPVTLVIADADGDRLHA